MCTKWWVRSALKKVFISQSFSLKNRCTSLNILNILSIFFCFGIFLQCTSTVYGSKNYQKERETGRLRRTVKVNICVGQCTVQCTMPHSQGLNSYFSQHETNGFKKRNFSEHSKIFNIF